MSTPNQPDDKNVDRGAPVPPWKRGEQTASTGLTAGEMAKAAGIIGGSDRAGDRAGDGTDSGADPVGERRHGGPPPRGVVSGDSPTGSSAGGPTGADEKGPSKAPASPAESSTAPASASASAPAPASKPAPATKPAPFVESQTRNIPREQVVSKDPLPDLDSIHHTEQAKEQALARASVKTIAARSSSTPLRAAVQIRRVDPWSVFKISGVLCVVGFFIWMIAIAILYGVLGGMGIWEQINSSLETLGSGDDSGVGQDLISGGQVFMFSALFGVVGAVLTTALATISAYIYNVCADFVGGVEVTLADLD